MDKADFYRQARYDLPGYDPLAQAMSGFISVNGEAQGNPVKAGTAMADDFAGVHGALATLAAVYPPRHTGEGQHISVPRTKRSCANAACPPLKSNNCNGRKSSRIITENTLLRSVRNHYDNDWRFARPPRS